MSFPSILNPVGITKEEDALKEAKYHFSEMKDNHIIKQDNKPNYYIYKIKTTSHIQIGFLGITNIQSFISNKIVSFVWIFNFSLTFLGIVV